MKVMEHVQFTQKLRAYSDWRTQLISVIEMYQGWRKKYGLDEDNSTNSIANVLQALSQDRLMLAFVAEFSRGKTELINSLFFAETGVRLLPSSPGRTTMCPAELFYDYQGGNYIRLLDIESRYEETSFARLKQDQSRWTEIKLERGNPSQMQAAFQELVAVKHVPKQKAIELGLFDEAEAAEQGIIDPETVEIPCWRHALISFEHPLLQAGLGILDTPGLNALGSEPELTISMLPSVQAIVFVLAADTGVTKSDLSIWNNHILSATNASKQGLAVVMNKIDAMWDDIVGEEGYEKSIASQIQSTAKILGINEDLIFPVSAKQALVAKLKNDDELLEESRIEQLENYLSSNILEQRQKILLDYVLRDIGFLIKESYVLTESSHSNKSMQYQELVKLTSESQGMIEKLTDSTQEQQEVYIKNVERFKVSAQEFNKNINALLNALSTDAYDELITTYKVQIDSSLTTMGMKENIKKLFDDLRKYLQQAVVLSNNVQSHIIKIHSEFGSDYGFKDIKPSLFEIKDYQNELEDLFNTGEDYRASAKTLLTEKSIVIQKLYNTIIFQARSIIARARYDALVWGKHAMSPLKSQIYEHKKQIENKLKALHAASTSKEDFNKNIQEVQKELQLIEQQIRELKIILRDINRVSANTGEVG